MDEEVALVILGNGRPDPVLAIVFDCSVQLVCANESGRTKGPGVTQRG